MRVVFVSDIHSDLAGAERLGKWIIHNKVCLVVVCGDFTQEGSCTVAEGIISALNAPKLLAVPGNMDSAEIAQMLESRGMSIHKKFADVQGYRFIGLGGAKPANTYYRINMGELEAEKCLRKLFEGAEPGRTVLACHSPPFGTGLGRTRAGIDLGLRKVGEIIEEKQPLLFVCGHVHEARGSEMLGRTLCINTGALKDGSAVAVELGRGKPRAEWIEVLPVGEPARALPDRNGKTKGGMGRGAQE